ncbi:chromodomain-helicase-DNA-binding protein 8-like isoform X2 [Gigantopelta aegis]|uniref:chromodomain-helicase-DNA-binding protein 8-like isoform X2 n=1 Tax=Gigantopelta aegis TaxID=1735272 RepID=UPI001B88AB36|nr:chromodomain-helicase-DNA-binding protein 8-like isoform X2 [Gigantopelta aegis]
MSLFESDTSFLEELTGPGSTAMGSEVMSRMGNGIMSPAMQQQVTQQQPEAMMMGQQQQPPGQTSYGQMQSFSQESFRTIGSQNTVIANQQYQADEYNQYSSVPKLHHINDQMMSGEAGSNMMQQQQKQQQQQQFISPPSAQHMMQPRHGGYQNYGMSPGPRMPKPQQMGAMQNSGWNQTQMSPTHLQYVSQQQQMNSSTGQMSYVPQHDYSMSNSCPPVQRLAHYPDTGQPTGQTSPYMGSPPAGSHVPMAPSSSPVSGNMMGQMQQGPGKPSQVFQQGPAESQVSMGMSGFGVAQQYPSDYMAQRGQMNSVSSAQTSKLQHYSYPAPNQQTSQKISPNINDTSSLTHFPNQTSANMPVTYRPNFSGIPQQRATTPSPRPVPTPPTQLAVNHSNNTQGTFGQSSLQQLEQLVPQMGSISNTNPFQSVMQTSPGSNVNLGQKAPVYSNSSFQATTVISSSEVPSSVQSGMGISVNIPNPNHSLGPVSPSQNIMKGLPNQQNMNIEIQHLQQQIQQLYSMSQTQEIQQQMLDLQERVRILKAQQQQKILQMQQQQQQQRQQQPMGMAQSGQPGRIIMGQRPRMPLQQVLPQQKQMLVIQVVEQQQQQPLSQSSQSAVMSPTPPRTPQMIATSSPQRVQQPFMQPSTPNNQSEQSFQPSTSQPLTMELDSFVQSPPLTSSVVPPLNMSESLEPSLEDPIPLSPPTLDTLTSFADNDKENCGQEILVDETKAQSQPQLAVVDPIGQVQVTSNTQVTAGSFSPVPIPSTVPGLVTETILNSSDTTKKSPKKPRKKREPKPKGEKPEKKEKSPRVRKKKKKEEAVVVAVTVAELDPAAGTEGLLSVDGLVIDVGSTVPSLLTVLDAEAGEKKEKKEDIKKEKKPKTPKPKTPKKKKPPPTFLKKKKKSKRGLSSDCSDLDISPPSSPKEEDESLKRRSSRNTNRKKYLDDVDINLSDDENTNVDIEGMDGPLTMKTDNSDEDAVVVEKILGVRMRKRDKEELEENPDAPEEEEEFIVKYKNYSFLHCEWKTMAELEKCDKRIQGKIKRFKVKRHNLINLLNMPEDEEYFNPDYVEVDRVLEESITVDPMTENKIIHYLVKWRGLSYEESTWELLQDVDPKKVELFNQWRIPPPEEEREILPRPKPSEWKKLDEAPVYKGGNQLREYQQEGVNWLTFCWYNRQNCILADEMGLGKTIQSITFLIQMYEYGIKAPYLIVAPLSTIANWHREFEMWTDLNVITYHGTTASRLMLQEYEMYYKDSEGKKIPDIYRFNALITTYELIITDWEVLSSIEWRCLIIDEAHRLKNRNCRLMDGLRQFDIEHRVLLSGTPLQNNTDELFSLLNFLDSKKYCNAQAFVADFGDLKTETQVDDLKKILKPMMLRRLKEDVEKNLAPKEETIIEVELTNIQKKYYRAILEKNFTFLDKSGAGVPSLMNTMMELRKCCNHPYLVNGAEEKILDDTRVKYGNNLEQFSQAIVKSCGKMVLLDKLLPKLKQGGHKILIFSQMVRVLDILEDYLIQKHYLYERLDGRIRGNLRQEAIDRFSKPDSDRFVFLLCTRAGGLGINLTAADTVIIYDSDWNPQNDLQAQARCHRIGQTKEVKVYRLITRNSYEREMFDRASLKLGLDKAVLQSDKSVNPQSQLSKKEIEDLLKKGAYGALMDDDNAGDEFCEEDIDQILQRRTQVIQIESETKGSTFAKASFSMSSERSDIDINDPNFWQKWAKKADIDVDEIKGKNNLIIDLPRRRKQTSRYGNEDGMMEISDVESSSSSDEDGGGRSNRKSSRRKKNKKNDDDVDYAGEELVKGENYWRSECFKVEKNLLVYGWGRWSEIVAHSHFKRALEDKDVKSIAKAILVHSLQFYKGDERIKGFIWDLVSQDNEDQLKNHSGLSAPVPRGRKGKKAKQDNRGYSEELEKANLDFDPDAILDHGYKRHLHRHSNKVLLRVRLLYYLRQEVIGEEAEKVFKLLPFNEIDIPAPIADGDLPALWWDEDCDKSLIIGVFKHGYEKFNQMRSDPALAFLQRCGPPDGDALAREQNDDDDNDKDEEEMEDKLMNLKDEDEEEEASLGSAPESAKKTQKLTTEEVEEVGKLPWPTVSDLNTRLRRLVTGYQRNNKKVQLRLQQRAKKMERREKADAVLKEREVKKKEYLQKLVSIRWSRREEADFYRTVSTFGVEYNRAAGRYRWDRFRCFARLDKKYDDTLVEYFQAFYHMCQRVCGKFKTTDEAKPPHNMYVEPISEERASRCLARIDLLNKIREEILLHPKLDEHIKLCQPSFDMPSWWQCGKNDKELLIGAARHGLARTDYHILRDPTLSFHEIFRSRGLRGANPQFGGLNSPYTGMYMGMPGGMSMSDMKVPSDTMENTPVKNELGDVGEFKSEKIKSEEHSSSEENCLKGKNGDTINEKSAKIKDENDDIVKRETDSPLKKEYRDVKKEINNTDENEKEDTTDEAVVKKEPVIKTETVDEKEVVKKKMVDAVVKEETGGVKNETDEEKTQDENEVKENEHKDKCDIKAEQNEMEDDDDKLKHNIKTECTNSELIKELEKDDVVPPVEENGDQKESATESKFEKELKDNEKFVKLKQKEVEEQLEREKSNFHSMMQTKPEIVKMEEDMMRNLPPYPGMYLDENYIDMEGMEPGEVMMGGRGGVLGPTLDWPKDRVVFHRLEHICYTIENGEWPFARRQPPPQFFPPTTFDSRSGTPVGSSVPKSDQSLADSDAGDSATDPQQNEGLKMTFQKRGRGRRRKYDIYPERAAQVQQLLNQSAASAASSDNESQPEPMNLSSSVPTPNESIQNGDSPSMLDVSQVSAKLLADGLVPERKRRGRKRKAEKLAELAMAEALAKRHQARLLSSLDPEGRVPVICIEDGSRLTGEEAPMKKDAERWLMEHPNYILDQPDDEEEPGEITHHAIPPELFEKPRRGRRPKLDPRMLDLGTLTGEENVSVIDRESGKKITGAKAPPLRHLAEWLEKNPTYDVEAKWGELVRAKGSLPKSMDSRILKSSGRGRKSRDSMLHPSFLGEMAYPGSLSAMAGFPVTAGLMGAFPKLPLNMPFGALPNLALPNPMLSLGGLGLPGFPLTSALTKTTDSDGKDKTSGDKDGDVKSDLSSTSSPHPSFPSFYYNPLMYNPLLAAQGLPGFPIPTSLSASLAGLVNPGAINGRLESEEDEEQRLEKETLEKIKEFSHKKAKLSNYESGEKSHSLQRKSDDHRSHSSSSKGDRHHSKSETKAEDLSMKKRHSHNSTSEVKAPLIVPTRTPSLVPQEEATDLSIKTKTKHILNTDNLKVIKDLKIKKSKSKMFSSSKLSKIVDSLKDKVMKIEKREKPKETMGSEHSAKPVMKHSEETKQTKESRPSKEANNSNETKESRHSAKTKELKEIKNSEETRELKEIKNSEETSEVGCDNLDNAAKTTSPKAVNKSESNKSSS